MRARGYSPYLSEIIAMAYGRAGINALELEEILKGGMPTTKNFYTHIIATCVNRHRVLSMPKANLIPRVMAKSKLLKQMKGELAKDNDIESRKLYRYMQQRFFKNIKKKKTK